MVGRPTSQKGPLAVRIRRKGKQRAVVAAEQVEEPSVAAESVGQPSASGALNFATAKIKERIYTSRLDGSGHAIDMLFVTILTILRSARGIPPKYSEFNVF